MLILVSFTWRLVAIHRVKNVAQHLSIKVCVGSEEPFKLLAVATHMICMPQCNVIENLSCRSNRHIFLWKCVLCVSSVSWHLKLKKVVALQRTIRLHEFLQVESSA